MKSPLGDRESRRNNSAGEENIACLLYTSDAADD